MIDVAVIGAGLGGLAAAVHCARAGLDVAVFERGPVAGGFAATWRRGPYTFEASLHALDGVGPGEPNRRVFEALGIADDLAFVRAPSVRTEIWPDGRRFDVPVGRAALGDLLATTWGCRVDGLLDAAAGVHRASYAALLDGADAGRELRAHAGLTGAEVLARSVDHPDAQLLLGGIASWQGGTADTIAGVNLLLLLHGYHVLGGSVPRGGSAAIVAALVRRLTEAGGRLHLDRPVDAIRVSGRRVRGVSVGGEAIDARHVVSAIAPAVTFGSLLPPDRVPAPWARRLAALEPSGSLLRLTAGLRSAPALPHEALVRREGAGLAFTARHVLDSDAAPAGAGVSSVSTPWPAGASLPAEEKAHHTDRLIAAAEEALGVGLREQLEHVELAHPGTYARYAGTPGGAVFGHPPLLSQSGARALGAETPIPHLWQAGAWVFPGPGQTAALISGRLAAHRILQACGRPDGVRSAG